MPFELQSSSDLLLDAEYTKRRKLGFGCWEVNQNRREPDERVSPGIKCDVLTTLADGPLKGLTLSLTLDNFADVRHSPDQKPKEEWSYHVSGPNVADTAGGRDFSSFEQAETALFDYLEGAARNKQAPKEK